MDQAQKKAAALQDAGVWELVDKNQLRPAMVACQQLNRDYPGYAPGWHTASQLAMQSKRLEAALYYIENAVELEPDRTDWLLQKALCLCHMRKTVPFNALVDTLLARESLTADQCSTLGLLLTQLERRAEAIAYYRQAAELRPGQSQPYYNIAVLQRSLGQIDDAEQNLDTAIGMDPRNYEAYKVRSELRTQSNDSNHVKSMEKLLKRGITDPGGKVQVCFALAKELEDLGEWERSFHFLKEGAATRRSHIQYQLESDLDTMSVIRKTYNQALFDRSIPGCDNAEAIFILGMPRTGTTLVERILASHSNVFAAGELGNFVLEMMAQLRSGAAGQALSPNERVVQTAGLDFRKLGDAYIASTRPATGHTARFIDKLPLNYLYAGLIHLALPNAKIINLTRHPMDSCYAIYKQLFLDGYAFSYDLEELGHYYAAYLQLMEHWNTVMPGVIHTVVYEDLVADVEGESTRLLQYCGLEWQEQVLKFYESQEASNTASSIQVRQPVYKSSVAKWKRYEKQLEPLISVLRERGIATV